MYHERGEYTGSVSRERWSILEVYDERGEYTRSVWSILEVYERVEYTRSV